MASKVRQDGFWTKDRVLAEARKYQSRAEWRKAKGGSMFAAFANGWMQEATAHMQLLIQHGKWTKDVVLADAKKFSYQSEWIKASPSAFDAAKRKNWLEAACAHMVSPYKPMGYWTKERLIESASQYTTRSKWKKANASAYATALQHGWLEDCCLHMTFNKRRDGYWTKERCIESAKKYSTIAAWSITENGAYDAAKGKTWYNEAIAHMVKIVSHGEHTIYSFLLQHSIKFEYQKRFSDLKDKSYLPYDFYLNDFNLVIEYMGRQHFNTSKSSMYRKDIVGIQRRDGIKKDYAEKNSIYYLDIESQKVDKIEQCIVHKLKEISKVNGINLDLIRRELTEVEKVNLSTLGVWSKDAVLADALNYKTLKEWAENGNSASQIAYKNGWFEEATAHIKRLKKPMGYWTKERILEDAMNYDTKMKWLNASQSAYATAQTKGWLHEATAHMKKGKVV